MDIIIKQEENTELPVICNLIEAAFANMQESDHQEHHLVDRLHKSDTYIPELSLVAKTDQEEIVGYILLTKAEIVSESEVHTSLAVAPLAVLPEYQNRGIGGMLLKEAHKRAAALGMEQLSCLGIKTIIRVSVTAKQQTMVSRFRLTCLLNIVRLSNLYLML